MRKVAFNLLCVFLAGLVLPFLGCKKLEIKEAYLEIVKNKVYAEVALHSYSAAANEAAIEELRGYLSSIDQSINTSSDTSLIYQFNNSVERKQPFEVDKLFFDLLELCEEAYNYTDGYFDPAVYPLVKLWKVDSSSLADNFFAGNEGSFSDTDFNPPSISQVEQALAYCNFVRDIDFYESDGRYYVVKLTDSKSMLDFGGIAKGYFADEMIKIIKDNGISNAWLSIQGSTNYFLGKNLEHNRSWRYVGGSPRPVQTDGKGLFVAVLSDQAFTVSGDYQRGQIHNNTLFCHIINPKTGMPVNVYYSGNSYTNVNPQTGAVDGIASSFVFGTSATLGEILSTYSMLVASDGQNGGSMTSAAQTLAQKQATLVLVSRDMQALVLGEINSMQRDMYNGISYYTIAEELRQYGGFVQT